MPPTVQARLLGVHFYLEARTWPATFFFDHEEKIMTLRNAECPLTLLPQRNGKPYVREHLVFLLPDKRLGIAMIDLLQPDLMSRLRVFIRQYLPILRHLRDDLDLLIVTADKRRAFTYQRLLRTNRTVHKLGLGALTARVKPYSVKPPVPTIDEVIWPTDSIRPDNCGDRSEVHSLSSCEPPRGRVHMQGISALAVDLRRSPP